MGKKLIITGADFSNNALNVTHLTKSSADFKKTMYINLQGKWGTSSITDNSYFYLLSAGQVLKVTNNADYSAKMTFISLQDTFVVGNSVVYANGLSDLTVGLGAGNTKFYSITEDCYLMLYQLYDGNDVWPSNLTVYNDYSRIGYLSTTDADISLSYYIRALDNAWRIDTVSHKFFSLLKGMKVSVTYNPNHTGNSYCALTKAQSIIGQGKPVEYADNLSLVNLQTTQTFEHTLNEDALLYLNSISDADFPIIKIE